MSTLRISDAPLLPDVDGTEKIPTGGRGDYAITVDQIKDHIFQDVGKELVGLGNVDNTSDLDKPVSTAQQAALNLKADKTYVDTNLDLKADKTNVYTRTETSLALSTKADLVSGVIPSNQLPSYVDDVVEYTTNTLPIVGESGKIYVTTDTNRTWRWSGNQYVEISNGGISDSTLKLQTPRKIANVDFDGTQNIDIPHNNLTNRNIENSHTAASIGTANGENQQEINDYNGAKWRNKSGGYALSARVTLDNGGIVKSIVDGNTVDPNEDMTGWVNPEADQNKIINKTALLEPLAESVDATPFLQALISAMPDGMTLDLLGKTFRVKKNTGFASDYPKGDQPCLVIKNKKNINITNGKLIVKEHGQGVFDAVNSTGTLLGVTLQGVGNFPLLDGSTGRGEKGEPGQGYFYEDFYNTGDPRNNSVDTSGFNTGGYGGNFPQWGGGTASTWGAWNGGFIKNFGDGFYALDSEFLVDRCDIYGFNGFSINSVGTSVVEVTRSKLHDNYTGGVYGKSYDDGANKYIPSLDVYRNQIYNMGHPDASRSHVHIDPGYGVATSNAGTTSGTQKYNVFDNKFWNCKRKAVDAHNANFTTVSKNEIWNCGHGVVVGVHGFPQPEAVNIDDNFIRDCWYTEVNTVQGIAVSYFNPTSAGGGIRGAVSIRDNTLLDIGLPVDLASPSTTPLQGRGIEVNGMKEVTITGNKLHNEKAVGSIGINTGTALGNFSCDSILQSNIVTGLWQTGIFQRNLNGSAPNVLGMNPITSCLGNTVKLANLAPFNAAAQTGIIFDTGPFHGNKVLMMNRSNANVPVSLATSIGGSIEIDYNLATKALVRVRNINMPTDLILSDIVVTAPTTELNFNLPRWLSDIKSVEVTPVITPTAPAGLVNNMATSSISNTTEQIAIVKLYSATNTAQTGVTVSTVTAGYIRVRVNF